MTTLETIIIIGGSITALGIIFGFGRKVLAYLRGFKARANQAFDAINGREEIVHPETGEVLLPAAAGIVYRVAMMEDVQKQIADSMTTMADTNERIVSLETAVTESLQAIKDEKEDSHAEIWAAIERLQGHPS